MEDDELLVNEPSPRVRLLTLNRPERRNALSTQLLTRIADAFERADADDAVLAVVVTGGAKVFAAGADLDELAGLGGDEPLLGPRFLAWQRVRALQKPLIGAVEGWCLGGGLELAMACDVVVAGASARFGQPETNLGIIPGGGGTALLPRMVGRALATRMILTGEPIDATRALGAGLIGEMVTDGTALACALGLAERIAGRAPLAIRAAKASLADSDTLPLASHLLAERRRFVALLGTGDKAEGIAAFREKRAADWTGH